MESITLVTTESTSRAPAFFETGFGGLDQPPAVVPVVAIDSMLGRESWIPAGPGSHDICQSLHLYQTLDRTGIHYGIIRPNVFRQLRGRNTPLNYDKIHWMKIGHELLRKYHRSTA